jgi:hypothetical protein
MTRSIRPTRWLVASPDAGAPLTPPRSWMRRRVALGSLVLLVSRSVLVACALAPKQPPAGVQPTRLVCRGLGAHSSPVCSLSRWTTSRTATWPSLPGALHRYNVVTADDAGIETRVRFAREAIVRPVRPTWRPHGTSPALAPRAEQSRGWEPMLVPAESACVCKLASSGSDGALVLVFDPVTRKRAGLASASPGTLPPRRDEQVRLTRTDSTPPLAPAQNVRPTSLVPLPLGLAADGVAVGGPVVDAAE